ncbi:MAG: hypothetical protein AAF514_02270 [Verrucomicrobiota bacterium]
MNFALPSFLSARFFSTVVAVLGALVWLPSAAEAQLFVQLSKKEPVFVAHEPVNVLLTLSNRTGRKIKLAGPSGRSWLNFQVKNHRGNLMSPRENAPIMKPITLASGEQKTYKVNLNAVYPVNRFGNYRVLASVYEPGSAKYFDSNSEVVTIDDPRPFWQREINYKGRGKRMSLHKFRGTNDITLYFRMADVPSGVVERTYALGKMLSINPPQIQIDGSNRLHVLYQHEPREWVYAKVNANGKFDDQSTHSEVPGNRPKLVLTPAGKAYVTGGMSAAEKAVDLRKAWANQTRLRKLSERPADLRF